MNPVETYVVALCLSSDAHDYIKVKQATPRVGAHYVWDALHNNIAEIGDMIQVYEMDVDERTDHKQLHRYVIDCHALSRLIDFTYLEKARQTQKLGNLKALCTQRRVDARFLQKSNCINPQRGEARSQHLSPLAEGGCCELRQNRHWNRIGRRRHRYDLH